MHHTMKQHLYVTVLAMDSVVSRWILAEFEVYTLDESANVFAKYNFGKIQKRCHGNEETF